MSVLIIAGTVGDGPTYQSSLCRLSYALAGQLHRTRNLQNDEIIRFVEASPADQQPDCDSNKHFVRTSCPQLAKCNNMQSLTEAVSSIISDQIPKPCIVIAALGTFE